MELKIKIWDWSTGLPVAMLSRETAAKLSVHPDDRVVIKTIGKKRKEISTLIDIIKGFVKNDEIAISTELRQYFDFKEGQKVEVNPSNLPDSLSFIKKKLNRGVLSEKEIKAIIKDTVDNSLSEAEIALFISGIYKNGMTNKETICLTKAIEKSGAQLNFAHKKIVADKHSIGGVPGNRTTPILVPICATAGLLIPKNSSRAITSAAGTADVVETIARVEFSIKELRQIVKKAGACMVWGGALELVPADSKMIKVEKSLKIDPEPMLIASIMSKKLAAGSNHIIIDIPCGNGAKLKRKKAQGLKRKFESLGKYFKIKIKCVLTDGSQPIGNGIGPSLEMRDILRVLDPHAKKDGDYPHDLERKSIFLAGELLELTGKAKKGGGFSMASEILRSGAAFKKFKEIIAAQSGGISKLKSQKFSHTIKSSKNGRVVSIDNYDISSLARVSGCPLDKYSGIYLHCHVGTRLWKGEKVMTIYSESKSKLKEAVEFYKTSKPVKIK